jgi:hypothetical protein
LLLPAALVVALLSGAARAAQYHVVGLGLSSCGTWTADRRANGPKAAMDGAWVLGFLSGVGYAGPDDPLTNVDADGVWAWVDNYCRTNPISSILDAAKAFTAAHPH